MKKYSILFYCTILAFSSIKGQINTYSPYSYFGLGDLYNGDNTASISMGGLGITVTNTNLVNYINPATYSSLNQTSFEIGTRSSHLIMYQNGLEQKNFISGLLNLGLGFPISEKIGLNMALLPYSSVGYNVTSEMLTNDEIGTINYTYSGSGGLNKFLFGAGWEITKSISVGLNWNYFFGSIDRVVDIAIENTVTKFREAQTTYVNDFNFELGLLVTQKVNKYNINIGATMSPKKEMKSSGSIFQHTYYSSGNFETLIDTILDVDMNNKDIMIPLNYSVGLSVGVESKWLIGLDYKHTSWEEYLKVTPSYSYMSNRNEIILGGRFTPKKNDIHNYFNQIEYRMGVSYSTGYLDLNDAVNVEEFNETAMRSHSNSNASLMQDIAISIGMGLPINKISSTANIGLRYGNRMNVDRDIMDERYMTIYFSMTLNEKWFKKRKIE